MNLSAALAALRQRVLLVDLDPQAHATLALGQDVASDGSMAQVLLDGLALRRVLRQVSGGFELAPSCAVLAEYEEIAARRLAPERALGQALEGAEERFDWCIVDCPPRADGILAVNAMRCADVALLVVDSGTFALQGAIAARRRLEALLDDGGELPLFRVLANLYDRNEELCRDVLVGMQARFGTELFDTVIGESVRLRESAANGVPVNALAPRSRPALDFGHLAQEVLELLTAPEPCFTGATTPAPVPSRSN